MERLKESLELGRNLGSSTEPEAAAVLMPPTVLPIGVPGKKGCGRVLDGATPSGATRPSVPMRKLLAGVEPLLRHWLPLTAADAITTPLHCTACIRPVPSSGTRTRSTPFRRP